MFGQRIAELRKNKGMNQMDLALELGVSQQCIHKYEREKTEPSIDAIIKMCSLFDCSSDYLLGIGDNQTQIEKRPSTEAEERALGIAYSVIEQPNNIQNISDKDLDTISQIVYEKILCKLRELDHQVQ